MNPLRILLLSALILVVFGVSNASAIDEKEPKRTYPVDSYVSSLDISADGKYIVAGTCYGGWGQTGFSATVTLFKNGIIPNSSPEHKSNLPESGIYSTDDEYDGCPAVSISDNGIFTSYTSAYGQTRLNINSAEKAGTDTEQSLDTSSVCFTRISANGKRVVTVSGVASSCGMVPDGDKSSIVRSYSERNNVWQLDMSYTIDGFVRDISLSADGKYAVVGTSWGTSGLLLFDLDSTENHLIWTYGKDASSNLVSISKNGNYIVASLLVNESYITTLFYQQTVLWSLNEAEGSLNPTQIQISNDGNYILIGNSLFSKDSPTPIRSFDDEVSLSEGSLLLSDNGENILATGSEGNLYFFDRDSSSPLWIINLDSIHRYVISSDGKHVAVVTKMGDNYYVYFYEEGLNFTYLFGAGVLIFIVAGVIISRKVKQAG